MKLEEQFELDPRNLRTWAFYGAYDPICSKCQQRESEHDKNKYCRPAVTTRRSVIEIKDCHLPSAKPIPSSLNVRRPP